MYRTIEWIAEKRGWGLLFLALFLSTGCGARLADYMPWQDPAKALLARLDEGNRLFMAGDYSAAADVFQSLRDTGHQEVIRPALYGLACSRFMLADSRPAYADAARILELWQRISPTTPKREDPRMLLVLFSKPASAGGDVPSGSAENILMGMFSGQERIEALEEQLTRLQEEMTACEAQKASAMEMAEAGSALEEKLKAKEEDLRAMSEALSKLREQMRTLETIDQEIQEKKQGIASP